ncbi:2-dehydropantoate 2-reductase [Lentibacillus sp. N15]|uniref:2-dehydropantoate 2-reductase n=1 Tax=Lentibacillus songyuanensis TaxID=3136161 RepID=UPI0031BB4DAE
MKIGIIGGGAIGLLLGAYLCRDHNVTIYVRRNRQKQLINEHGIFIERNSRSFPLRALLSSELQAEDCYVVCVKQQQLGNVLHLLTRQVRQSPVLFLQNGMGHVDLLHRIGGSVYVGVVEHGALKVADNVVAHTGAGRITVAVYHGKTAGLLAIVDNWHRDDFPVERTGDWKLLLGKKLIVNAVINPLTALFDVVNGGIIDNPDIRSLGQQLCFEGCEVLGLDASQQWEHVQTVAMNTRENVSSMLKDIREQRQTENEAISGYLLKHTKKRIPYTSFVYTSIKAMEKKGLIE